MRTPHVTGAAVPLPISLSVHQAGQARGGKGTGDRRQQEKQKEKKKKWRSQKPAMTPSRHKQLQMLACDRMHMGVGKRHQQLLSLLVAVSLVSLLPAPLLSSPPPSSRSLPRHNRSTPPPTARTCFSVAPDCSRLLLLHKHVHCFSMPLHITVFAFCLACCRFNLVRRSISCFLPLFSYLPLPLLLQLLLLLY